MTDRLTVSTANVDYVAFDLETTGLLAQTDRIVEIAAIRFDLEGRERGRFVSLVNPGRPMSPSAQAVHGITDADLADAPPASVVLPRFVEFLASGSTLTLASETRLIAHNGAFDAAFLGRELIGAGVPIPPIDVIDTLALARKRLPHLENHRLESLSRHLGLDTSRSHRAWEDSLRVKELWLRLRGHEEPRDRLISFPIHDPRRGDPVPEGWEFLKAAINQGKELRIEYAGGSHGNRPRIITPKRFAHRGGVVYLVAYCHLDQFEKSFRLDRILHHEAPGTRPSA
jgi:DNA polymerase III epsilon subunit family exonuclease